MKVLGTIVLVLMITSISGCASSPKNIEATYVSPLVYKDYDCDQIIMEMDHVSRRTAELMNSLQKKSSNDKVQAGIGLILFWPVLFALEGGDGPEAAEYARLKGEYEALRQVLVEKKCASDEMPPSPTELYEAEKERSKSAKKDSKQGSHRR